MKGILLLITIVVCFLFCFEKEEIRIRVISNSNDVNDIIYKDDVVNYLKEEILNNQKLTEKYFRDNYLDIQKRLNEKFDNINVTYEYHNFPIKTYNGNVIDEGKYKTLLIKIGNGLGSNWWGSVFEGSIKMDSKEEIKYEWYIKKYIE